MDREAQMTRLTNAMSLISIANNKLRQTQRDIRVASRTSDRLILHTEITKARLEISEAMELLQEMFDA